ncbi:MAG TPA: alcohol dehydrogenase catalytic domain-containing protein [Spirochaetia bacterium]|nr:alcohol dehydrogenase catalytic domain-containing protein [Spirochaetia bacterium]
MRSVIIEKPETVTVRDLDAPRVTRADEVLVKVMASGICGTDVHIYHGEYLGSYPMTPGHEFSGVVVEVGEKVTRFAPGARVAVEPNISCDNCAACLSNRQNFCENWQAIGVTRPGAMAQYVLAPEKVAFDAGEVPFDRAAFMEPVSCVVHGIESVGIRLGDNVAVIGTGPIGMLLIRTARSWGASRFTVAELSDERLAAARRDGVAEATRDVASLPADRFDVVIDATGAPAMLLQAVRLARPGGRILMFGVSPKGKTASIEPFQVFRKGLSIFASYTSRRNSLQALSLIASERVRVDDLVSHRVSLSGFEKGIHAIEDRNANAMKVMIFPNDDAAG